MGHRYNVGDHVSLAFGFPDQDAFGTYEILSLLPTRPDSDPQYRIRGSDDRVRVIGEAQIGEPGKTDPRGRSQSPHNPITDEFNRHSRKSDE